MVLPMGALGDKIGFKRLLLLRSAIFGIASLCAALSLTPWIDCLTRFAGGGAAMIVPATLAGIRSTFAEASQRNMARGCGQRSAWRRGLRPAGGRYPAGAFTGGRCS